jgi:hypothetical protein
MRNGACTLRSHVGVLIPRVRGRMEHITSKEWSILNEYRQFQRFREERETFFEWLEAVAARNAERNVGLSDEEVLDIIERAREKVAGAAG